MSSPDLHILERICVDGVCHCDWRLTLVDCAERKAMVIIHGINVGISGITLLLGIGLLIHRIIIKGHTFFELNSNKGFFRPKPIDCMLLFIVIFNLLRLISSAILITDVQSDMVSRSFLFEIAWQFGYGSFALYLIGIAQTLADSHKVIANSWLPSPKLVDIIGGTIFLAPFITNNCMSLGAGILARTNLALAETFTRVLYIFWFVHCSSLAIAVVFSGYRLIKVLEDHIQKFNTSGPRYTSVKTGIYKIKAVMSIITICLLMFAAFLLLYGILRELIMVNVPGSLFLGAMWNFLGAVATFGVECAVIFNPKIDDETSLGLKTSSNEKSTQNPVTYTNFSVQEYATTNGNDVSFQGTLSHNAFDDLKNQQEHYESVFQKHNNNPHHAFPNRMENPGELKVSELGIPMHDLDYADDEKNKSYGDFSRASSFDEDNYSQSDLVNNAARH